MTTAAARALAHSERPRGAVNTSAQTPKQRPEPAVQSPLAPVANSFSSHVIGPIALLHPESNALFTHRAPPLLAQRGFVQPAV